MSRFRLYISLLLFCFCPLFLAAGTYYVSPTGTNGSTGSQTDPLFLIQEAIDKCVSGQDTVWLVEGSYWQRFSIVNKQGIYLSSLDAANKSTVSGSGVVGLNQILIQDSDSITIANLILRENFEQEANAIYVVGEGDGIFITDNEIFNVG